MNDVLVKSSFRTKTQLCLMMFLQYMLSAVWWVPLGAYLQNGLKFSPAQISYVLCAMAIEFVDWRFPCFRSSADHVCTFDGLCRGGHVVPYADTKFDKYHCHAPYCCRTISAHSFVRFDWMGCFRPVQFGGIPCSSFVRL